MRVLQVAKEYRDRGWTVVALDGKKPKLKSWEVRGPDDVDTWNLLETDEYGVGIVLGSRSGNLIDIDLDCREAEILAPTLLPPTGARFGHEGMLPAHYLYVVEKGLETKRWLGPDKKVLVEFRGESAQTRFPPSDDIRWTEFGQPAKVTSELLHFRLNLLSLAIVVARNWPESQRHLAALALAGALKRRRVTLEDALSVVRGICEVADDDECSDRLRAVEDTYASESPTTGLPSLTEIVGKEAANCFSKWLPGAKSNAPLQSQPALPYCADASGMYKLSANADGMRVQLSNFSARIVHQHSIIDGALSRRIYSIEARVAGETKSIKVDSEEFGISRWVERELGVHAIVTPRRFDEFRAAVQYMSADCTSSHSYAHTGWVQLEPGTWSYLHAGGATSAAGVDTSVECRAPSALAKISFSEFPTPADFAALVRLAELEPSSVSLPGIAAVVRGILAQCGLNVFIVGRTGTRKTTLAALLQSFVGRGFDARSLPASFQSTANALEIVAHHAKDAPLVIDDFCPSALPGDFLRGEQVLDRLCRSTTEGASRDRSTRDAHLIEGRAPRATLIVTAESMPGRGSLRHRMVILEQGRGIEDLKQLTACQDDAAAGCYERITHGWIRWIAGRRDELVREVEKREKELRNEHQTSSHSRIAHMASLLHTGFELFCRYLREAELGTHEEVDDLEARFLVTLIDWKTEQAGTDAKADSLELFYSGVAQVLSSGTAHVDFDRDAPPAGIPLENLGWRRQPTGILPEWTYSGLRLGRYTEGIVNLHVETTLTTAREILGADAINLPTNAHQLFSLLNKNEPSNGKEPRIKSKRLYLNGDRNRYAPIPYERLFPKDGAS